MSIKGYPSNQKIIQSTAGITHNYATVVPTDEYRNALDTPRPVFRVDSATVPRTCGASTGNAQSGPTVVVDTATVAKVGDIFRAEDGDAAYVEVPIVSVSINGFILASRLNTPPAAGDTFYILRSASPRADSTGAGLTTVDTSLLATSAKQDAAAVLTGAVNETAPATDTASSGLNGRLQRIAQRLSTLIPLLPQSIGQQTSVNSLAVVLASDQSSIPVAATLSAETTKVIGTVNTKSPVNANGSIVNTALTATTASSASAPANAVGFIISAAAANDQNIRWCIGGTASTTVGNLYEPGRDSGFIPCAATISVCAVASGTNAFAIQWILSA